MSNTTTYTVHIDTIFVNSKKLRKLSNKKVEQYALAYERGDVFPPIEVNDNGDFYTIHEGRHRYQAQLRAGYTYVDVELR